MDVHRLKEDIRQFIQSYTINQGGVPRPNPKVIEADLLWDASRFWANVIHKASPIRNKMTNLEFLDFKSRYESQNNISVNSDRLFDQFWLRNVLGFVEIPGGICRLHHTFEKISIAKGEFLFLDYLYHSLPQEREKQIDKDQLSKVIIDYNAKNNANITIDAITGLKIFDIKDNQIKLDNFEHYYSPFLTHWEDFKFLFDLKQHYYKYDEGLEISKLDFVEIHSVFSKLYPLPAIESFIEQKLLLSSDNSYRLNFRNTDLDYRDLWDKIAGVAWEIISHDPSFNSDNERILSYLPKVLCWGQYPNALPYCSEKARIRFLNVALSLVENEKDLDDFENEFKKVRIDSHFVHGVYEVLLDRIDEGKLLDNSDLFELYHGLSTRHIVPDDYPCGQEAREWVFYLLWIIVRNDLIVEKQTDESAEGKRNNILHFKRITRLLSISKEKPSLLYMTVDYVIHHRRELVPHLLTIPEFIALSFQMIDKFPFLSEEKEPLSVKLWTKCLQLSLQTIAAQKDKIVLSKIIFQIFRQINFHKYDRNNGTRIKTDGKAIVERERQLLDVIEICPTNQYSVNYSNYLLPAILNELASHFINFKEDNIYNNGVLTLPLAKLDGLSWVMKCATMWRYRNQLSDFKIRPIYQGFYDLYSDTIEIEKVDRWGALTQKREHTTPIWAEKCERTKVIDWLYPIWYIYKNRLLDKFLEPSITFNRSGNYYDTQNRFAANKLRSHIAILLQIHNALILPIVPYGLNKETIGRIKRRIEEKIVNILEDNSQNNPQEGKIDVFDFNQEWGFGSSPEEALLPQIAQAINYFYNKDALIDIIINTNDLIKILTFADSISSEKTKQKLVEKIKQIDIGQFLHNSHWIPEIESAMSQLAHHSELLPQIELVLDYWEKEIIPKRPKHNEYKKSLYRIRLLIAYFKRDVIEMNNVEIPDSIGGATIVGEISDIEIKEFYKALIMMEDTPHVSYNIFNTLIHRYPKPQYVNIAMNRMAAKINLAKKEKNIEYYHEALAEWEEYILGTNPRVNESELGSTLLANKMLIYFETQQYDLLKRMYSNLDPRYQVDPAILKIQIDTLNNSGEVLEASRLIEIAQNFHKITFSGSIGDITKIAKSINENEEIEELRSHYNRIFSSAPEKLIRILPENINGNYPLSVFFTYEFALAADKMLDKIMSISEITGEDKFNDIIELTLDSRINPWGLSVGAQSRGGFSGSSTPKQPGERDLPIMGANKTLLSICEAFVFRDKSTAMAHIQKIFNYYHTPKNLIILVYHRSTTNNFEERWGEYLDIVKTSSFPSGCAYQSISELTTLFGYCNSRGIRIARSNHEKGVVMHHIFVNIDYRAVVNNPVPSS